MYKYLILLVQKPRILFYRVLSNNKICGRPRRLQPIQAMGAGSIVIAENVRVGYLSSPSFFSTYAYIDARGLDAEVRIGRNTWINNNISIIAEKTRISIGEGCLIGVNVEIIDSDFHPINPKNRKEGMPNQGKSVSIGNDVFIGSNVRIMKGVSIGDGATIANGAVVSSDIPSLSVAGGNPAKIIKYIEE